MSKTKYRSLGIGFLFSAMILAAVSFAWPFVPQDWKAKLDEFNLPSLVETVPTQTTSSASSSVSSSLTTSSSSSSSQATSSSSNVASSSVASSSSSQTPTGPVTFVVEQGELSTDIARNLEAKGLVKSATEFAQFVETNGYAQYMRFGTFELKYGMTYQEIADIIGSKR